MLDAHVNAQLGDRKFIVVANREPYIHRYHGSRVECIRPASGMASALDPILTATGGTWIAHGSGDADRTVVDSFDRLQVPPEDPTYTLRRLWLTHEQEDGFYNGLANEGLWPLCHLAFTPPDFRQKDWEIYREVNMLFARAVLEEAGDRPALVFIQDYHFALLPRMLKELAGNQIVVAHFWHIPWPNPEVFRTFPWGEELLDGLLGNDLLGFQIRHDCQNFLETVDRTIEARIDKETFEISRHASTTLVRPFPISIDFTAHAEMAGSEPVEEAMKTWRSRLRIGDRMLGIGVERLDYTKGIPERLKAFDALLATKPEWRGNVTFAQIAAPTRSHLEEYRGIEEQVDDLVAEINDRWGEGDWEPILLLKQHYDSTDMIALHRLADFCIVSSLHDGMNLVAKEFAASRIDEQGVLILSKFTGSHRELPEALEINPFAIHEVAEVMNMALRMPSDEQQLRMSRMREQVAYNNVYRWAAKYLSALLRMEFSEFQETPHLTTSRSIPGLQLVA